MSFTHSRFTISDFKLYQTLNTLCACVGTWCHWTRNTLTILTQWRSSSCCLLLIVYMCSVHVGVEMAKNLCFRGWTSQIWKTKGNRSKNELFVHLSLCIWMLPSVMLRQQKSESPIDHMHKWRWFEKSFVYIEISPTSLVLEFNFQKNMLPKLRLVGLIWM